MTLFTKQRGFQSVEMLAIVAAIMLAVVYVGTKTLAIGQSGTVAVFSSDAQDIVAHTYAWKKRRNTFKDVSMSEVCSKTALSKSICGDNGDGKNANPYGGDWTLAPHSNTNMFVLTATIPNDSDVIPGLADTMAPSTRGKCDSETDCSTISYTTNSLAMTY